MLNKKIKELNDVLCNTGPGLTFMMNDYNLQ